MSRAWWMFGPLAALMLLGCAPQKAPPPDLYAVTAVCFETECEVTLQRDATSDPLVMKVPVTRRLDKAAPLEVAHTSSQAQFHATAACTTDKAFGEGRHQNRQQAMLIAARACAADGGMPSCCSNAVTVSDKAL